MFSDGNGDACALLGLPGVRLLGVEVGAELVVTVETTADRVGCRSCGVIARAAGGRRA